MNIVVVVGGGLSETLQASALLSALRAGVEKAQITLAAPPAAAELASLVPAADEVLLLAGLGHGASPAAVARAWFELRRRRIDLACVCSARLREAGLVYGAGIARRLGAGTGLHAILLSDRVKAAAAANDGSAWLSLAGLLGVDPLGGGSVIEPGEEATRRADALLSTAGIEREQITLAIAPGAAGAERTPHLQAGASVWDPLRYAHLANAMWARHGAAVVLLGPEEDRAAVNAVLTDLGTRHIDLCGELSLAQTAAVLRRCDLLVCGDSPLLHLAAAVGTPSLGLFGPTDGRRRGPFGPSHRALQALPAADLVGRRRSSVDRIRVEDVLAGIEAAL